MRRSRLENYEAILSALAKRPLTVDSIAYRTSMDCTILQRHLESLLKYGLVHEEISSGKRLYKITERGMAVFRTLSFQRRLDNITKSIRTVGVEAAPTPLIRDNEKEKARDQT
ncbi:MAG: winged helix-turn-helix domain-containing protein [Candidatus Bathyarchaeia archaeon]|nr:ArsR family transcriptional regulator [Candidatus Bathyarchaeota archaeon]